MGIKVKAIKLGYYNYCRRRPAEMKADGQADVFEISKPEHFSKRWMEKVPSSTPPTINGGEPATHELDPPAPKDRLMADADLHLIKDAAKAAAAGGAAPTGDQDVI